MIHVQNNLDNILAPFEKALNIAGYIPIFHISTFAGAVRITLGKVELLASLLIAGLAAGAGFFAGNGQFREQNYTFAKMVITNYGTHGLANIGRGAIEFVPYLSLFTCLPYDLISRYSYPKEGLGAWQYIRA